MGKLISLFGAPTPEEERLIEEGLALVDAKRQPEARRKACIAIGLARQLSEAVGDFLEEPDDDFYLKRMMLIQTQAQQAFQEDWIRPLLQSGEQGS